MRKSRIDDSAGRTHRPSKIALPTKRSTLGKKASLDRRSISEDRGFSIKKSSLAVPRSYHKRSTSATPMRTPIRTPMSLTHGTTSKKTPVVDKKWFTEKLTKIFSYIGSIEGVDKNFVASKNIKMMSIKDFLRIVCHLAKFWMPGKVTFSKDYADDIYEMLIKLRYSYRVNKSWLKTPNAPHALNDVTILISWLLDAVPETSCVTYDEYNDIKEFPTTAFAQCFQQRVRDAYQLWNNGQDQEAAEVTLELLNEYIKESVNYSSEEDMQKDISALEVKCDAMEVEANAWDAKQQMVKGLQNQLEERNKQLKTIQSEIESKSRDIELYALSMETVEQTMKDLLAKKEAVEKEWQEQKQENRSAIHEQLLIRVHEEKIILQSSVELSDKVKEIGFEVQVEKSRLLKKLHDLTNESNLNVESVLKYRPAGMEIDNLTLEPNVFDAEKIGKIHENLSHIQQIVSREIQKNNMQIISLNSDIEFGISRDIDRYEKSMLKLTEQFNEVEASRAKFISTSEHNKATLDGQIETAEKMQLTLDQSIEVMKEQLGQEEKRQQEILKKYSKDSDKLLQQKQEFLDKTKAEIEYMSKNW